MEERLANQPPSDESPGGPFYGELIKEALTEERARKDSLERRGISMVSASAFLSTLVLGLLTFSFHNIGNLPRFETGAVWVAISGFVLAAAGGLAVNWPLGLSEPTSDYLEKINEQAQWDNSQKTAAHRANQSRILTTKDYRQKNGTKARLLTAALIFETIGIISLAVLILALI
jgi:hypothetical protein